MARPGLVTAVCLGFLVVLGAGLSAGIWLTRPQTPPLLRDAEDLTAAPVVERRYDDARTVELAVSPQEKTALPSPADGRVTASSCVPGGQLTSGSSFVAIDGAGLLSLSTAVPPWRDLAVGNRGDDVAALNDELRRLGLSAPDSNRVTWSTITAYRQLTNASGAAGPSESTILATNIAWLPALSVTVASCDAPLGSSVSAGDALVTLDSGFTARVSRLPQGALPGERILSVDGKEIAVNPDGTVTSPEGLQAIAGSASFSETTPAESGTRLLSVRWQLQAPATVSLVPPAAVLGAGSDASCIVSPEGEIYSVRIVGSELGQTFVLPDKDNGTLPTQVQMAPNLQTQCG